MLLLGSGVGASRSAAALGFLGAGKLSTTCHSCEYYFETRPLALVMIWLLCFDEADGAYHPPADFIEPDCTAVVGEPSERVMPLYYCHGIFVVLAWVCSDDG